MITTFKGFLNFYLWKMTLRMLLVSENQAVQWLMHFSLNIVFDCLWWDHFSLEKLQTWDTLIRLSTSKLPSQQIIYRCNKMKSFHEESVLRHQMILWTNELKSFTFWSMIFPRAAVKSSSFTNRLLHETI